MQKSNRALKPFAYIAVLFATLGIAIANVTLSQLGLESNYAILFSMAFVLAILMVSRNWFFIAIVLLGVVSINLPNETLWLYGLDRDVLIAMVCAIILVPTAASLFSQ